MALDVYFKEDIRNVLRATYVASEGTATLVAELLQDPELCNVPLAKLLRVYREGFLHALGAVGLAFGLDPSPLTRRDAGLSARGMAPDPLPPRALNGGASPEVEREDGTGSTLDDLDLVSFLWVKTQYEQRR